VNKYTAKVTFYQKIHPNNRIFSTRINYTFSRGIGKITTVSLLLFQWFATNLAPLHEILAWHYL
jgi:hypothetical protein